MDRKRLPKQSVGDGGPRIVIAVSLILVTALHYGTPAESSLLPLHDLWRRLYYVPIILGSFRYGIRGGFWTTLLVTVLYAPHVLLQWSNVDRSNQYIEIIMFWVVGIITGLLADELQARRNEIQVAYDRLTASFERARDAERLATMGQLAAGLSHEIRNPLASIKGSLPILLEAVPEDDDRRQFVDVVRKEITRLEDLTTQFLEYARPPQPSWAMDSLNDIAHSVAELVGKEAERAQVDVVMDLDEELGFCEMDSNRIRQVVLNLALNAIQAMPDGGAMKLRTFCEGGQCCLEVDDDGPGLTPEAHEHLFEPFFTTKRNGTGLGLAVAYQWMQRHGGSIEAGESGSGGARFTLRLPPRRPEELLEAGADHV